MGPSVKPSRSIMPSAPTDHPTCGPNAHNVVCGKGSDHCTEGDGFLAPNDALHEVRCCSDVSLPNWMESQTENCNVWILTGFEDETCYENKSYYEAQNICVSAGGRLCTKAELEGKCTEDSGCGFDNDLIWSGTGGFLDGFPCGSMEPSGMPSAPTSLPTREPNARTVASSLSTRELNVPSSSPSDEPSIESTDASSSLPSNEPTGEPTNAPSSSPSDEPSSEPTDTPSSDGSSPSDEPPSKTTDASEPTDTPSSLNAHNVVCGKGRDHCTEGDGFLAPNDALHEVRCCSNVSLLSWTKSTECDIWVQTQFDGNKCHENKSYCEANKICAHAGGRLCTKAELEAKCTIGTGCEFDNDLIWSQTEGILGGSPNTPACAL